MAPAPRQALAACVNSFPAAPEELALEWLYEDEELFGFGPLRLPQVRNPLPGTHQRNGVRCSREEHSNYTATH